MRIGVFGLGYVGCVSAACLAPDGHEVIGVDVNEAKVEALASGRSPVRRESGLDELVAVAVEDGCLVATVSGREAIHHTDLSFICVGTPSQKNGNLNLEYVERVCDEIGEALATKPGYQTVAMRSTVLPNTVGEIALPSSPLAETLVGHGYAVSIFDEDVRVENLIGANRQFLEREIPHIASLMSASLEDILSRCEVLVVANEGASFSAAPTLVREDQVLIDLVGVDHDIESTGGSYEGVCW